MRLVVTTWNVNSVRLRINLVTRFLRAVQPDVICLQETKCPDDKFPRKRFAKLGYIHAALNGQKGYHGVAILSRLPIESIRCAQLLRQERFAPRRRDVRRAGWAERSRHAA